MDDDIVVKTPRTSMCNRRVENLAEDMASVNLYSSKEKCSTWLDSCTTDESLSVCSELSETSESSLFTDITDNSAMDSGFVFDTQNDVVRNKIVGEKNNQLSVNLVYNKESPKYDHINIYKSRKVHIGDVTIVKSPIIIEAPREESRRIEPDSYYISIGVVSRTGWLAQPPINGRHFLEEPAEYVIICHTATEEGFTQAENTLLVRLIQTFHIDSRKWSDIAYNFLIGSDGLAYEGRGWKVQGAHTKNYNARSVGLSFIGCFLNHLPPTSALNKAKELIEYGVNEGLISKDYRLIAHRQCSGVESPGQKLYEEIQTWDRWDSSLCPVTPTLCEKFMRSIENIP